jgi:putative ABC transport system permease protein
VLSEKSNGRIASVSTFGADAVPAIGALPGVTHASGVALLPQEVLHAGRRQVTVDVIGVEPGGLGAPRVSKGSGLAGNGQIVVDARTKLGVGSSVQLGSTTLHVVGRTSGRTLTGGVPVVYLTLADVQTALLGGQPVVTAVATTGVPSSPPPDGLRVYSVAAVERDSLSSLSSAVTSIQNSRSMMWVVAAIIIAALIYVSALQRVRDFAVLKALGSSSASLFASLCLQAVIVTLLAAALGTALSTVMTGVFSQPVSVPGSAYATLPIVAVAVGVVASLVALRRATGADPVAAFGG